MRTLTLAAALAALSYAGAINPALSDPTGKCEAVFVIGMHPAHHRLANGAFGV